MNLETITSKQNSQIKTLKKLALVKHRESLGKFAVENLTIIYDAFLAGHSFVELFVTQEFIDKHRSEFEYLQTNLTAKFYLITEEVNKSFSQLITAPGLTAVYNIQPSLIDLKRSVIYLNSISDPGNLGTILRTALAFDFKNIVLDKKCVDVYNSKTIQAAKDAIFKLNILVDEQGDWLMENKDNFSIYTTSSHQGKNLSKFKPAGNFCLVLGSESHGVDQKIVDLAKEQIRIEMTGQLESLNVATATAILLYSFRNFKL